MDQKSKGTLLIVVGAVLAAGGAINAGAEWAERMERIDLSNLPDPVTVSVPIGDIVLMWIVAFIGLAMIVSGISKIRRGTIPN